MKNIIYGKSYKHNHHNNNNNLPRIIKTIHKNNNKILYSNNFTTQHYNNYNKSVKKESNIQLQVQ
jgi:hypothetical protein